MNKVKNNLAALGLLTVLAAPGVALSQDTSELKGLIIINEGSTIVVRQGANDIPITLTPSTKIRGTSGALGVRGDDQPASNLIRGLPVEVKTTSTGGVTTATEVRFKNSDLRTAQQMGAALVSTDDQVARNTAGVATNAAGVAANSARIDVAGELVPAGRAKVFFDTGSTRLTEQGKMDLMTIASQAKGMNTAYRFAVVGRADPTGNAAANRRLSEQRAAAVKAYLIESGGVSPAMFLPMTGLGDSPLAEDPDPPANNAEARRVTVTIAVSKSARPN